MENQH
ncbi:hypothetical protein RDI58_016100 [Solanum bulbocastanum]